MNTPQRIALGLGFAAAAWMVFAPPLSSTISGEGIWRQLVPAWGARFPSVYLPLFDPPLIEGDERFVPVIAWGRLLAQGFAVALLTGFAFVILGGGDKKGPRLVSSTLN